MTELLVMEPGVQINTETKAWPTKLSLEINIAGDIVCVCVCFVVGGMGVSIWKHSVWGSVGCLNSNKEAHNTHSTHRQILFLFVVWTTYRRTARSNAANPPLKIEALRGVGGLQETRHLQIRDERRGRLLTVNGGGSFVLKCPSARVLEGRRSGGSRGSGEQCKSEQTTSHRH